MRSAGGHERRTAPQVDYAFAHRGGNINTGITLDETTVNEIFLSSISGYQNVLLVGLVNTFLVQSKLIYGIVL